MREPATTSRLRSKSSKVCSRMSHTDAGRIRPISAVFKGEHSDSGQISAHELRTARAPRGASASYAHAASMSTDTMIMTSLKLGLIMEEVGPASIKLNAKSPVRGPAREHSNTPLCAPHAACARIQHVLLPGDSRGPGFSSHHPEVFSRGLPPQGLVRQLNFGGQRYPVHSTRYGHRRLARAGI